MDALLIAVTGLGLLLTLACIIGRVEANARDSAWHRIADARRELQENQQRMITCVTSPRCSDCPIRNVFGDQYGE